MNTEEEAFSGLSKDQRERMLHKLAGINEKWDMQAYLQGVVDGRALQRIKGAMAFLEAVKERHDCPPNTIAV